WSLYESLLCQNSAFFRKELQGSFKEGKEKKLTLPDDEPEVFELFVQWLLTGGYLRDNEIRTRESLERYLTSDNGNGTEGPTELMVQKSSKAWILGDKLQCEVGFKNYAMNHIY
ncbi:uncharacterized protein BDZ99DRAFT_364756, partial [Mytilinidion resinicola]